MSTPITISLFCNGRQKDYKAVFTDNHSLLQFKVMIDESIVCFEGGLEESFRVKNTIEKQQSAVDKELLDAVSHQLNQIFF